LDAVADLAEASLRAAFAVEVSKQLPVSGDQDAGALDDEGDLVIAVALAGEEDDTGKGGKVVFDRAEGVIEGTSDLVGLGTQEEESDGLGAMGEAGSDVLLLAAGGNLDAGAAEDLDVADEGAQAAVEQAEGEVFVGKEAALLAGLGREAQEASAAEADDATVDTDLEVIVAGVDGETDGDLLTSIEGLAGGFVGGDDEEFDLAESELAVELLGIEGKDFLGGLQNGIRDEGRTVGAGFDAAAEQVIEGFGIGALAAHFVFETARTDHGRHLRSKRDQVVREVRSTGLPRRCQVAQNRMSLRQESLGKEDEM
jgi:hypothetical protein